MPMIDEKTRSQVKERLAGTLAGPVELHLYRRPDTGRLILPGGMGCVTCEAAEELARVLEEAAPELVSLTVTDVSQEGPAEHPVPAMTVGRPGEEPRITFQGLASGYEFASLLDAVERVSSRGGELSEEATERVAELESETEIMVFVTPTCPYCPSAASMASRMALASEKVRAVVVEANEFPELSQRFQVQGVPRTVVNRSGSFVGALPEPMFVDSVVRLASPEEVG